MLRKFLLLAISSFAVSFSASAQTYPQGGLLNRFLNGSGSNCQVIIESSHTYHQMYVNGQFKGNYQIGYQDAQLENMLYRYVSGGACRLPTNGGYPPPPPPYGNLTYLLMNNGSLNCYVIIESSRTYHQIYVNGQFKGNYLLGAQDAQLENMISRYVSGGACRLRY